MPHTFQWTNVRTGMYRGATISLVWTVIILLLLSYEPDWRSIDPSPLMMLGWLWISGVLGGAVWVAGRHRRHKFWDYVATGIPVGIVFTSSLALLMIADGQFPASIGAILGITAGGIPAGGVLGGMCWAFRSTLGQFGSDTAHWFE